MSQLNWATNFDQNTPSSLYFEEAEEFEAGGVSNSSDIQIQNEIGYENGEETGYENGEEIGNENDGETGYENGEENQFENENGGETGYENTGENDGENLNPKLLEFKMDNVCSSSSEDPEKRDEWVFVDILPSDEANQSIMMDQQGHQGQQDGSYDVIEFSPSTNVKVKSRAEQYFEDHSIVGLFEYCVTLLVYRKPNNPTEFLKDFFEKAVKGKGSHNAFCSIPRNFHEHHLEALFRRFDKERTGFITGAQYMFGMDYIGVQKFANNAPKGIAENKITQKVFASEGVDAISRQIRSFMK